MSGFTLSDIEDKWMEEMSKKDLSDLSTDFYQSTANYVAELDREIEESEDIRQDLLLSELKHVMEMVQEIHFIRTLKIMDFLFGVEMQNLLEEEEQAFTEIRERFGQLREDLVEPILRGESELRPPREKKNKLVLLLAEIPERITCSDMRVYGPFGAGDIANLPEKSADLLVRQGLAESLDVKEA